MTIKDLERIEHDLGELLERHPKGKSRESFDRYRDKPAEFIEEVLGARLYPKQREICEAVRDNRKTVIQACVASGKDFVCARLALWWAFSRPAAKVIITSATGDQLVGILMEELRAAFAPEELPGELRAKGLLIDDRRVLEARTAVEVSRMTGFHGQNVLFLASEAQGLEEMVFEAGSSCCASPGDRMVFYGNPLSPTGTYFKASRSPTWHVITINALTDIIEKGIKIRGLITQSQVDDLREFGDSIYIPRVLGEFPPQSELALIRMEWLRAVAVKLPPRQPWKRVVRSSGKPQCLAFDPAVTGDRCAIAWWDGRNLREIISWKPEGNALAEGARFLREVEERMGTPTPRIYESIPGFGMVEFGGGSANVRLVVDAGGLGRPVYEWIANRSAWKVIPFIGSESPRGKHSAVSYLNRRAESYALLAHALERKVVTVIDDQDLFDELTRTEMVLGDKLRLKPKHDIKADLGVSPDLADAATMGFWGIQPLLKTDDRAPSAPVKW